MLEFAVVLPIFILFVFGIIEFGRAYSARVELTSAVREGARAAALKGDWLTATRNGAPGLTANQIAVATTPNPACPTDPTATDYATVTATYPFHYSIPFFGTGTWTLKAKGVMRCGG